MTHTTLMTQLKVRSAYRYGIYCAQLNRAQPQRCVVPPQSVSLYRHYSGLPTLCRHGVAGSLLGTELLKG